MKKQRKLVTQQTFTRQESEQQHIQAYNDYISSFFLKYEWEGSNLEKTTFTKSSLIRVKTKFEDYQNLQWFHLFLFFGF